MASHNRTVLLPLLAYIFTELPMSIRYAAVYCSVLPAWRIPNPNPFAPSLIPSIWPPKVTFRHRPLEEGSLMASPL